MTDPAVTPSASPEPLTPEEEAGIRSGWWESRPNRGALAVGYVGRLLATLDRERAGPQPAGSAALLREALRKAIGTRGFGEGLPHWHYVKSGETGYPDRPGVYVERQAVLDAIDGALEADPPAGADSERTLDVAWAEFLAALPDGWVFWEISGRGDGAVSARIRLNYGFAIGNEANGRGHDVVAALTALRAALSPSHNTGPER